MILGVTIIAGAVPGANIVLPFVDCKNASLMFLVTRVKLTLDISGNVHLSAVR